MQLLIAKITIDRVEKFAKLFSAKLISLLIRQTLVPPNFRRYGISTIDIIFTYRYITTCVHVVIYQYYRNNQFKMLY